MVETNYEIHCELCGKPLSIIRMKRENYGVVHGKTEGAIKIMFTVESCGCVASQAHLDSIREAKK